MSVVRRLYLREMRSALRERGVWIGTLILPVLLGPVTLWLILSAVGLASGTQEQSPPRIGWLSPISTDAPTTSSATSSTSAPETSAPTTLKNRLDADPNLVVETDVDALSVLDALRAGRLDLGLELVAVSSEAARLGSNRRLLLSYDASRDRSVAARQQVLDHVRQHRQSLLRQQANSSGIDDNTWQIFEVESRNLASASDLGGFILGLLVPLFTVIMVAVGCIFPAVETIAGERERKTWETTLSLAVARHQVILAKYFYVATCGVVAGTLNLIAVTLSMRAILAPVLGRDGGLSFQIPPLAIPLILLCTILLALLLAAGMMLLAVFARSFKEGQALISPFLLLCLLPLLLVQSPDMQLDATWVWVPVANVALLFKHMIGGHYPWGLMGLTLVAGTLHIALCLALARWLLRFEELWVEGSSEGIVSFLKHRWRRSKSSEWQGGVG